ncbi:unnamed protein product [Ambrosiozyma monospora]|uniref:Unnamed protein product n=1 Tax=Ambrosiozyma monospora TaxID=43982 RepID=A0A9W6YUF8_AMBMO|nr:unnamed protein product [Ambrosiozyma monospora]
MSEAELKQRPLQSQPQDQDQEKSTSSTAAVSGSSRLASFDFVLKAEIPVDTKSLTYTKEADLDLQKLVKALDLHSFIVEVRPDYNSNYLLVFIKLEDEAFFNLVKEQSAIDSVFGIEQVEKITPAERLRIVYYKLTSMKNEGGLGLTVGVDDWKFVTAILPVSIQPAISEQAQNFVSNITKLFNPSQSQSKFIFDNFGSKYALYFKFALTYLSHVIPLATLGLVSSFIRGRYSRLFTFINLFIGVTFYLSVYFTEKKSAKDWKQTNVSKVEVSIVEKRDPKYMVLTKKFLFIPIAVIGGLILVIHQFSCFLIEITLTELYEGPYKPVVALIPTILISVIVPIATAIYTAIAKAYLKFENDATRREYNTSLLIKGFVFSFLASYAALFITSFIYLPLGFKINPYLPQLNLLIHGISEKSFIYIPQIPLKTSDYSVNQHRLNNQYKYFILTNQIIALLLEFVVPQILNAVLNFPPIAKLLGAKESVKIQLKDSPEESKLLTQIRDTFKKPVFDVDAEYKQLVTQFGYMIMFGPVWSVGPVISVIIDIIQINGDYAKLLRFTKTPIPDRSESSYPWPLFIKALLYIGAFTSSAITLMYNGGDIQSSVFSSSVKFEWYQVLPLAGFATLAVQVVVFFGEWIIDEYFSEDEEQYEDVKKLQSKFVESLKSNNKSINNVETVIRTATAFPSTLAVKEETEKEATKKSE